MDTYYCLTEDQDSTHVAYVRDRGADFEATLEAITEALEEHFDIEIVVPHDLMETVKASPYRQTQFWAISRDPEPDASYQITISDGWVY